MKWIGQHIWDFISRFRSDVYLEAVESGTIASGGNLGLDSNNKARNMGDINFYVPAKTYGIVECAHQVLLHLWLDKFMNITEWDRRKIQNMNSKNFQL